MRYTSTILALAATTAAAPFAASGPTLCPTGLFSNPQCCATDVLGAVGLNCGVPATAPTDTTAFIGICAATGQQAKCCVIPVAGQDVLCQDVSPAPSAGNPGPPAGTPPATIPGGGGPAPTATPGVPGLPGGGASSEPCESSTMMTVPTPTAPAPPATTSADCGC